MPVCWRRDRALHGPIPGMHVNKSHLGSPVLVFRLAPGRSSLLEKPLPGASRPSCRHKWSRLHPSPPTPARVCRYQRFSCTKKSTDFLIVSC